MTPAAEAVVGGIVIVVDESRERARQSRDCLVVISFDQFAVRTDHVGAVRPQMDQADRKKLHDFARVILIGFGSGNRVGLLVLHGGQPDSHDWMERHRVEQIPVVAKRVCDANVIIISRQSQPPRICRSIETAISKNGRSLTGDENLGRAPMPFVDEADRQPLIPDATRRVLSTDLLHRRQNRVGPELRRSSDSS